MHRRCRASRSAFTLIELLVVIAIMAVLVALAAGAYFRVRATQEESATNVTLYKLSSQYQQQSTAEMDQAKQDMADNKVPAAVRAMAGDDSIRTRVVWGKIRYKMAFPQSFWEVLVWAPAAQQQLGIPQNATYRNALAGIPPTSVIDPYRPSPALSPQEIEQLHFESAALLFLALTQPRRGQSAGFNAVDQIGPHAVGEVDLYGKTFKVFMDTWRRPIAFVRWPFGISQWAADLNAEPFVVRSTTGGAVVDPADPEMRLARGWQQQLKQSFVQSVGHPVNDSPNPQWNLTPVIFSGGRDRLYGVDNIFTRLSSDEDDNVYGYRNSRIGGR